MSEPTPLSAEELAGYRACHRKTTGTTADAEGNLHPECICGDYWPCWPSQLLATIDAQATEIAALKDAREAKEREMLAEHSSAMQALLRWCAEDTPEDIRKGWEQESHEALRALAAGRPR